jgi:hypothetical protein
LQERFAAGEFDEREAEVSGRCGTLGAKGGGEAVDFGQDIREGEFAAFGECVGGVAVGATEVASGKADENAGEAGEGAFALEAQVDLVDNERVGHLRVL